MNSLSLVPLTYTLLLDLMPSSPCLPRVGHQTPVWALTKQSVTGRTLFLSGAPFSLTASLCFCRYHKKSPSLHYFFRNSIPTSLLAYSPLLQLWFSLRLSDLSHLCSSKSLLRVHPKMLPGVLAPEDIRLVSGSRFAGRPTCFNYLQVATGTF